MTRDPVIIGLNRHQLQMEAIQRKKDVARRRAIQDVRSDQCTFDELFANEIIPFEFYEYLRILFNKYSRLDCQCPELRMILDHIHRGAKEFADTKAEEAV